MNTIQHECPEWDIPRIEWRLLSIEESPAGGGKAVITVEETRTHYRETWWGFGASKVVSIERERRAFVGARGFRELPNFYRHDDEHLRRWFAAWDYARKARDRAEAKPC